MKVYISVDEWWPYYSLEVERLSRRDKEVEISEEMWREYQRIIAEFDEMQRKLEKMQDA